MILRRTLVPLVTSWLAAFVMSDAGAAFADNTPAQQTVKTGPAPSGGATSGGGSMSAHPPEKAPAPKATKHHHKSKSLSDSQQDSPVDPCQVGGAQAQQQNCGSNGGN
jgi:hypothetical protein